MAEPKQPPSAKQPTPPVAKDLTADQASRERRWELDALEDDEVREALKRLHRQEA